MAEQLVAGQGIAGREDIYAIPILELIRRVQVTYRIDWGHNPEVLELGVGQWGELTWFLSHEGSAWRECLTSEPPMLWGMRLVQVSGASGLMAR